MITLLLGAGFSKWGADLPVASQLFDFDIEPWGPQEERRLSVVKQLKEDWDRENPEGLAEEFIAYAVALGGSQGKAVVWYVVRRLSEAFIWHEFHAQRWRRHVLMIDEYRKLTVPGVVTAQGFLDEFCSPMRGIVTTNYDLLVEYALGTARFNYGELGQVLEGRGPYPVSQWISPVTLTGLVPLAKLHGSVSWDESSCYTDGRRGLTGNALIVPPTPEKEPPEQLQWVWEVAERILANATRLMVFGFAFNPYDEAVLQLLASAGERVESVLLVDINPNPEAARRLWSSAEILVCHAPPEGEAEIRKWQRKGTRLQAMP